MSTLAIVYGVGEDAADHNHKSLYDTLRRAKRTDGTPVFTAATCFSGRCCKNSNDDGSAPAPKVSRR